MVTPRRNTKNQLIHAFIRLAAEKGASHATTSAIAREAGITEGAIYRHYASKEELRWAAYKHTVQSMASQKQHLVTSDQPIQERIYSWIELTFAYYDHQPEAFTYVLLTPHRTFIDHSDDEILTCQGKMFMAMISQALEHGELRPISPQLALCYFTGLILNVPRLINDQALPGPALTYVDGVADAVWRVLSPIRGHVVHDQ